MELIEITNLEEGLIELDKQLLHVDQEQYAVGKNDEGLQPVIKSVDGIHHCGMGEAGRMSSTWLKQTVQWHGQPMFQFGMIIPAMTETFC